jgi:iron only hydrogenase large subunit-like protein
MGEDKKAKIDDEKCIDCGSCVNQCPFGAIMDKSYILEAIRMIKDGQQPGGNPVCAILAPSIARQFTDASFGQGITGLIQLGFHCVAEAALGADISAYQEAEELSEHGLLFNSCCPAFVNYTEKYFPDLKEHISNAPSPMVAIAARLKEADPSLKTVFIGPCIAKKAEYRLEKASGAVDCVLTFEELYALFESRGIDLPPCPRRAGTTLGGRLSAVFRAPRGVSAPWHQASAIRLTEDDIPAAPSSAAG